MNQEKEPQNLEKKSPEEQEPKGTEKQETAPDDSGKKEKKGKTSEFFHSRKFRRGTLSTAFTVGFIAIVVLVNVLVGILDQKYPSINLDLTKNGSNTLSSQSLKVVDGVKTPITISIIGTKQQVQNDSLYSNEGISSSSQVGTLAEKIAERNPEVKVEYIDLDKNPTFAAEYKSDGLTTGDVVVKSQKRYRVLTYSDLFDIQYGQDDSSQQVSSNVEGAYASALSAVTAEKLPVVAFDTGHSEKMDMTAYKALLKNNSFETKDFNLLTDKIPDGVQMIVLGYPTTDYTDAEIEKLSNFLNSKTLAGDRSLMVTFYPSQTKMPKLSTFLKEWGIEVPQSVVAESDQSKYISGNPTYLLSDIQSSLSLTGKTDQSGQSSTDYGYFITPDSCPINLLYTNKGDRTTYSLAKSAASSYLVNSSTKSTETPAKASYNTAALSQEVLSTGSDKTCHANVIAIGSSLVFSDGIVNSSTFGDGKYMADLSKYATGTSNSDTAVSIPTKQINATDITLTTAQSTWLGLGVFTLLIPMIIAVIGIMVHHKRRLL